jgi:hypothetical protein
LHFAVLEELGSGAALKAAELEVRCRDAGLSSGRALFSMLLSKIPETTPDCPQCGEKMRIIDTREKTIMTLVGKATFDRNYYKCDSCGVYQIPKDQKLEIANTKFTQGVKRVTAMFAASEPFADTSAWLREICRIEVSAKECERIAEEIGEAIREKQKTEIASSLEVKTLPKPETPIKKIYIEADGTGVPIRKSEMKGVKGKQPDGSAKTREMKTGCIFTQSGVDKDGKPVRDPGSTTYFGQIGGLDQFSELLYSEAVKRGVEYAEEVVVLGDGAKWIWNLANENFPGAIEIVDLYHAKEHVCGVIKKLIPDIKKQHETQDKLFALLDAGNITGLVKAFENLDASTKEQKELVRKECNYFIQNEHRMRYKEYREKGLFVGSGVVEAACKNGNYSAMPLKNNFKKSKKVLDKIF